MSEMSEIRRYVLVDTEDNAEEDDYEDYNEAYEQARKRNMAVIARVFEYSDSELIWTPDGSDTWPPEPARGGYPSGSE